MIISETLENILNFERNKELSYSLEEIYRNLRLIGEHSEILKKLGSNNIVKGLIREKNNADFFKEISNSVDINELTEIKKKSKKIAQDFSYSTNQILRKHIAFYKLILDLNPNSTISKHAKQSINELKDITEILKELITKDFIDEASFTDKKRIIYDSFSAIKLPFDNFKEIDTELDFLRFYQEKIINGLDVEISEIQNLSELAKSKIADKIILLIRE